MTIIACKQVSKTFDSTHFVLDSIDLSIEEEEFIMISGPCGAGKTTLLSILSGYLPPSNGEVTILSENLFSMNPFQKAKFRRENLGVIFQNGRLISSLTVIENVMVPLLSCGYSEKETQLKALQALISMGIENKKDCYLSEISGAEIELVALSRALINQPKLLLLDEPTQFLDHQTGVKVMTYLRQMAMDHQMTIICVTSDVRLYPFASRLIRMKGGKIVDVLGESFLDTPFLRI